jgi:hypothetical protein
MKDNLYNFLRKCTIKKINNNFDYKLEVAPEPEITIAQVLALIILFLICVRNNNKIFNFIAELIK